MTREQSFARLKELAEEEKSNWEFIDFLKAKRKISLSYDDAKPDEIGWTLGRSSNKL